MPCCLDRLLWVFEALTIEAIRDKIAATQSHTFSKYAENDSPHDSPRQRLKLQL
jgi:hypothetical protein